MSNSLTDRPHSCNGNVFAANPLQQPAISDFSVFGGPRSSTDLDPLELGQEFASLFTYRYRSANLANVISICHPASLPFAPKAT
jgi:hypothetical protein